MNSRQGILLSVIAAVTLGLTACGGSSSPAPPPAITVTLSGQPASLSTTANASITATVGNDSKNGGVNWTVTCAATPCGSFNPASTASGTATTYTAPAAPTSVTITATSASDSTKSATATITITAPVIAVAFNPAAPASINAGATSPLTAVVTNDSGNKGVTWKVTCGSSACGSFNPTSTASGTATTYTAPAAIPSPNTVTVTATSVTDTTKSATATITIGAPPPILADGNYVYHFSGWDDNGISFVAGAFTIRSGVITAGEQDFSDASAGYTDPLVPSGSGISTAGGNIQIVLATANTKIGVNGIETLRGTVVSPTRALVSEFDTFGTGNGSIDLQTSAAAPSGGYAFVLAGLDIAASQVNRMALGGVLNISGTSLSVSNSVFDYNVGGSIGKAQLFTSGTVTAPDIFGRVTLTLVPAVQQSFILTGYVVSPNQIQFVESQQDVLGDDLGGMALGQGSKANQFNQASIANTIYVFAAQGADENNGVATFAGSFAFDSAGGATGNLAINDFSYFNGTNPITGATYTVDATGRVTISNATAAGSAFTFQLYLDGNGNAFELGADALEVTSGPAYLQTSTAGFQGSYVLQGQGILNTTNVPAWGAVGPVTVSSSNAFTGFTDYTAQTTTTGATTAANQAVAGTETNSSAQLALTGLDSTALTTSRAYSYLPIDGKRVLAIEIDGQQLGILSLETITH